MLVRLNTKLVRYVAILLFFFVLIALGPKYITRWADARIAAAEEHRRNTSPVYLEHENQFKRSRHFMECKSMPASDVDGPDTCVTEAFSLYPDRNWKKIAADNAAKGL